jgi:hypothetical protein
MRPAVITRITVFLLLLISAGSSDGQTRTVGLLLNDTAKAFRGYTLFTPLKWTKTYLIDNDGMLVRSWTSAYIPGQSVMLLRDGSLLRTAFVQTGNPFTRGGVGGRVERFDWNGNLAWSYEHYGSGYCTHHDIEAMPNGNVLMIAWEKKTLAEAAAAGRNLAGANYTEVWSEKIIEMQPAGASGGTIVWEWHIWDHLVQDFDPAKANYGVVSQHPELFDINFGDKKDDWLHMNAIRYNPVRDEIIVSGHSIHEFWVIDHGTTTQQAASHSSGKRGKGGDLLYRWGNPLAYKLGTAAEQKLYSQHDARWIDDGLPGAGHIMIFNNGTNRPGGAFSSIEEIAPPLATDGSYERQGNAAFGPAATVWSFKAQPPASFFAVNISGATRMPNGNTLICDGPKGKLFEVTAAGEIVWSYMNPVGLKGPVAQGETPMENLIFKTYRYAPDYPGLAGKDLTPIGTIETYRTDVRSDGAQPSAVTLYQNYPNPFNPSTKIRFSIPGRAQVSLTVCDMIGRKLRTLVDAPLDAGTYGIPFDASGIRSGVLYARLRAGNSMLTKAMILMK